MPKTSSSLVWISRCVPMTAFVAGMKATFQALPTVSDRGQGLRARLLRKALGTTYSSSQAVRGAQL